ncbi:hypothetical protein [Nonomuraea dietziae]|uniref:hypothetical protein n=1 Tax=Nonomuraea dietziae TaxID=65515 RepID=UPI00342DF1E6
MPTASYGITCRARNRFTSPDGRPTIGRSRAEGLAERRGDADRALITERRGTHHRLGFALHRPRHGLSVAACLTAQALNIGYAPVSVVAWAGDLPLGAAAQPRREEEERAEAEARQQEIAELAAMAKLLNERLTDTRSAPVPAPLAMRSWTTRLRRLAGPLRR